MVTKYGERVYFDDLTIDHKVGPIVQENNFYAYGMPMPGISWTRPNVRRERSGYQGLFAQYDEETKLNRFQLRLYDARVGRWLSNDPYRQYTSPYVGMGNNPTNSIDPDGGYSRAGAFIRHSLASLAGMDPGNIYKSGDEWGYATASGTHYFGQKQSLLSNAYNSNYSRYAFHDMYSLNVSATGVKGMGGGTTFSLVWLTRGKEASFFPAIMTTSGARIGLDQGFSATIETGLHTQGSVTEGTFGLGSVDDISTSSLEGLGANVSGSYGIATGNLGFGLSDNGAVTWVTAGGGITTPGVGASVGLTKTTLLAPAIPARVMGQVIEAALPIKFMW